MGEPPERDQASPPPVGFGEALRFWLKLGFISFGGPAGQIATMHQELVERRRWISEQRFLHALNYCMLLPGPEAQQLATYMGWLLHGTRGGIVAGVLFVLPSLVILVALSWLYVTYAHTTVVTGLFYGIKPAVTAIVVQAVWRIGSRALKQGALWVIAAAAFVAIFFFNAPFPVIIAVAALAGYLGGRWLPGHFGIDATAPMPRHLDRSGSPWLRIFAIGILLWTGTLAALVAWQGWNGTPAQLGWFFTKAALLTFGGAYAALPYIYQGAVGEYGWLSPAQMIDGLALGETTPGPLIMIVAFVGFLAAHGTAQPGAGAALAGVVGAAIATWFTFLPSFLFVLGGAPLVEATRGNRKFTAPLAAITAAVVGVISNLALFFGYHVLWPTGLDGRFDWIAAGIALVALIALLRWRRGVVEVIAAAALAGLLLATLR